MVRVVEESERMGVAVVERAVSGSAAAKGERRGVEERARMRRLLRAVLEMRPDMEWAVSDVCELRLG
jgi:hypothetical protein